VPGIPRRAAAGPAPLSFAQQRLWFLDQFDPGKPYYNLPLAIRITGDLDVPALTRSLDAIVARHEVLRTTFATREGNPVQIVAPPRRMAVERRDISGRTDGGAALRAVFAEELGKTFDLAKDPMVRATLVRESDRSHVLIVMSHHIASDGWSVGVILQELSALYESSRKGTEASLPPLPIQYSDYAVWQREGMKGSGPRVAARLLDRRLGGELPVLELPADRLRPARPSFAGAQIIRLYPRKLRDRLDTLAREESATLFMTLLAAFQVLLGRLTGQEDVLVGTPVAGRSRTETENLIGCFVNTLVMRGDLSGNPTFREFLGRVRETALGAYAHPDLPFEKLVEELRPERTDARSPLYQVMFTFDNEPCIAPHDRCLGVEDLELGTLFCTCDVSLDMAEVEGGLQASMEYSTELFDRETVERWLESLEVLLEGLVEDAGGRIWELPVMREEEKKRLLEEWDGGGAGAGKAGRVQDLFEEQARKTPEAVAVEMGGQKYTYRELEERSNRLSRYLKKRGIQRGKRAGILLDRSMELPVALLGVLKAGGAYVPLDPGYPAARVQSVLEDSGVTVVVTESRHAGLVAEGSWKTVRVDEEREEIGKERGEAEESGVGAEDLAYVIYTSGSTGRPKGVMVEHRSLWHHAGTIGRRYELTGKDRVLQFASVTFDVAAEEMYPTWASGGTVVMRGEDAIGVAELERQVEREGVTVLNLPAGFWHEWVGEMSRTGKTVPGSVRLVVAGSDRVMPEKLEWWRRHVDRRVRWMNGYGPTETTITATLYEPRKGRRQAAACACRSGGRYPECGFEWWTGMEGWRPEEWAGSCGSGEKGWRGGTGPRSRRRRRSSSQTRGERRESGCIGRETGCGTAATGIWSF
jgi:amino acid adenylation domain-containing protein